MALITKTGHIDNAMRLYNKASSMYVGFGNANTEWQDASKPPAENYDTKSLPELLGMHKVTKVSLATPLKSGQTSDNTITYGGIKYQLVDFNSADSLNATFLYVSAVLEPDELGGTGTYRSVGLFTDTQVSSGVTSDAVPANKIVNQGRLQVVENRVAFNRSSVTVEEQFLIEA